MSAKMLFTRLHRDMKDAVKLEKPKETMEAWEFSASIGTRQYRVSVQKDYWRSLTGEKISSRELVFRSLLFLLEREPKESILSSFDLRDITTYFPEYKKVIREGLTAR